MDLQFLARLLSIVVINFTLSGDNAIVIAMAVCTLSQRQQKLGILWGTVAAVVLRIILTFVAAKILSVPFFQAVGGLLLIYIAIKLVRQVAACEEDMKQCTSLAEAIKIIIIADLVMSIDNVLAVAAASVIDGQVNLFLLLFGLGLSMPILMIGAAFISKLMGKYPWLVQVGAGILGWISGEMLVKDPFIHSRILPYYSTLKWAAPIVAAAGILLVGWLLNRRAAVKEAANRKAAVPEREAV